MSPRVRALGLNQPPWTRRRRSWTALGPDSGFVAVQETQNYSLETSSSSVPVYALRVDIATFVEPSGHEAAGVGRHDELCAVASVELGE